MASSRVLISEVEPDVRRLLALLIERLGHEPIVLDDDVVVPPAADAMFVDPRSTRGLVHARLVRAFFPELPLICATPLPDGVGDLGRGPILSLPRPFERENLEAALTA